MRIYFLLGAAALAYAGYEGIGGNQELVKMSLSDVAKQGVGDNRYLELKDCYATSVIVYDYAKEKPDAAREVYFPIMTKGEFISQMVNAILDKDSTQTTAVLAVVKRDKEKYRPDCINGQAEGHSCLDDIVDLSSEAYMKTGLTLRGTVKVGADEIDAETLRLLKDSNYEVPEKLILLEENEEPRGKPLSWVMLIGGILVFLGVLATFFGK